MLNPGKEVIGWEIFGRLVYGCKFFKIDLIDNKYIYAHYTDWRGTHTHKLLKKTGKELINVFRKVIK